MHGLRERRIAYQFADVAIAAQEFVKRRMKQSMIVDVAGRLKVRLMNGKFGNDVIMALVV